MIRRGWSLEQTEQARVVQSCPQTIVRCSPGQVCYGHVVYLARTGTSVACSYVAWTADAIFMSSQARRTDPEADKIYNATAAPREQWPVSGHR